MEVSKGQRLYIGLFGNTNSGKSSLMNMLVGQDFSIVSELSGTTTDSVQKNMELPGAGPCVFIDTAGRMQTNTNLMDEMKKIRRVSKPDLVVFVGEAFNIPAVKGIVGHFTRQVLSES